MPDDTESSSPAAERRGSRGRPGRHGLLAIGVVVAVALGGVALGEAVTASGSTAPVRASASCSPTAPKLTVQGSGQATQTPDIMTIVVAVTASGSSAASALAADNLKVTGAVAAIRGGGVGPKDIQTSGLSLQPQYAYPKGVPTVTGYQVSNTVSANLRDLSKAGAVIDAVVGAAGNAVQIQSVAFSVKNPSAGEDLARSRAVTEAATHAQAMARAAGRSLGQVCSLTDNTAIPEQNAGVPALLSPASASGGAVPVPIEAGSQTESDQITMVYALSPLSPRHGRDR